MHKQHPTPLLSGNIANLPVPILLFLATLLFTVSATAAAPLPIPSSPPNVKASGYILADFLSGTVLADKNADERMKPASLTKILTCYVAFSELQAGNITLDDEVTISEKAWRTPGSRTFLEVNTRVPVKVLLKGIIVQSGNDASVALAEHIAGDEALFAQRMNQTAKRLGLTGSHFVNVTGLPNDNHYSTARDMAKLGMALIRDFPDHYKMYSTRSYEYNNINQFNRNKLLWRDDGVDGIKTGYTEAAGYCLIASARRGNMRLISVVMGANSVDARTESTRSLLRYGFRFFETHRLYSAGTLITTVPVWKGKTDTLDMGIRKDLYITVPAGQRNSISADLQINSLITAPVAREEVYGKIRIALDKEILLERPIIALHSVPEGGVWKKAFDSIKLYFH